MIVVDAINVILKKIGAELIRFPNNELKKRSALLNHLKINKVLDVGANVGKYGEDLRDAGYEGEIISFEPLKNVFEGLNSI